MKKVKQLVTFYILIFSSAIFIQSCCLGEHNITDNGTISITDALGLQLDTLNGPFRVVLEPGLTLSENLQDLSLMNSSFSVTCDNPIENRIELNTV